MLEKTSIKYPQCGNNISVNEILYRQYVEHLQI